MDRNAKSMFIFSGYTMALGLVLAFIPKPVIWLFHCPPAAELGIRTTGLLILFLVPLLLQHKK